MKQYDILAAIVESCQSLSDAGEHPIVIFDLDSTLFDNGPRIHQIMLEYAEDHALEVTKQQLLAMSNRGLPYGLELIFDQINLLDEINRTRAKEFWMERFFTDHYQLLDVPNEGAVNFVNLIFQSGGTVLYLSGRDVPGMLVGCSESLRRHGFPIGMAGTSLILKPEFAISDLDFKTSAVEHIDKLGTIVATFDNEPGNCNLFLKTWPNAHHVFMKTNHHADAPPLVDGVVSVDDFTM